MSQQVFKSPLEQSQRMIKGDKPVLGPTVRVTPTMVEKEWEDERQADAELSNPAEFQPTKETIWNDPKHPLYGIAPSDQNVDFLKSAISELTRNTQSPAHFKFYARGSGGTMAQAKKQLEQYKKALKYIENYGGK